MTSLAATVWTSRRMHHTMHYQTRTTGVGREVAHRNLCILCEWTREYDDSWYAYGFDTLQTPESAYIEHRKTGLCRRQDGRALRKIGERGAYRVEVLAGILGNYATRSLADLAASEWRKEKRCFAHVLELYDG